MAENWQKIVVLLMNVIVFSQDDARRSFAAPLSLNFLDCDKASFFFSPMRKQQLGELTSENCLNTCLFLLYEHMKREEEATKSKRRSWS